MRLRHAEIGRRLQEIGIAALEELEQKIKSGEPLNLTAAECKTLLDVGRQLESEGRRGLARLRREMESEALPAPKKPN